MAEPTYRFRALETIAVDGVRAYNIGDWVPAENVELHSYEVGVLVERVEIPPVEDETDPDVPAPVIVPEVPQAPAEQPPAKKTSRATPSA
jgi:hypothetical protein